MFTRAKDGVFPVHGAAVSCLLRSGVQTLGRPAFHTHVQPTGDVRATGLAGWKDNPYLGLGYHC